MINEMADHRGELEAVAHELAQATKHVQEIQDRRDRLIVKKSRAGMSRRAVADATGLTPGRIQHIIDAQLHR
jgi:hypothetical protein